MRSIFVKIIHHMYGRKVLNPLEETGSVFDNIRMDESLFYCLHKHSIGEKHL